MKHSRRKLRIVRRGINPTLLFFLGGVVLLILGLIVSFLWPLALLGGFIVLVYLITAIVWIFFNP